mgnify:CR=1 FL=1
MIDVVIQNETDLATALKQRRHELGVTQQSLAKYANLSHNGISRIEMADKSIRLSTFLKIAKVLGFKIVLRMEKE